MFKFIHAADIHLDSPMLNLEQYDGAPIRIFRTAPRQALANLVELALKESVAFVLIAGDVYDGNWDNAHTGLYFTSQMARLLAAEIPVFVIAGNHDAANKMTHRLRLPGVRRLSHDRPESVRLDGLGVTIHGQGFAKPATTDNLAIAYPPSAAGYFNIGMLHTCANGEGHEPYAPCSIDDLRNKGYDYWALGHIHKRYVLCEEPFIAFSGNIQGRHIRETGAKGCLLVTVEEGAAPVVDFRPLDVLRWENCRVDVAAARHGDEMLDSFETALARIRQQHAGLPLALRVEVIGTTAAHDVLAADHQKWIAEIRNAAINRADGDVWIEKVRFQTRPPHDFDRAKPDGPIGELQTLLGELIQDPQRLTVLAPELGDLYRRLPNELKSGPDALLLEEPQFLREMLESVGPLLITRLSEQSSQ